MKRMARRSDLLCIWRKHFIRLLQHLQNDFIQTISGHIIISRRVEVSFQTITRIGSLGGFRQNSRVLCSSICQKFRIIHFRQKFLCCEVRLLFDFRCDFFDRISLSYDDFVIARLWHRTAARLKRRNDVVQTHGRR
ncbi:hypothetical protein SDC9_96756 [bioreactor metagenome]|uniref:Uncharacterized protein n=1 Tax=bioreactor metagenome TaxID=1076179 RepID=A0A645AA24_9ZZZZ